MCAGSVQTQFTLNSTSIEARLMVPHVSVMHPRIFCTGQSLTNFMRLMQP